MLSTKAWSNEIFNQCKNLQGQGCIFIPFETGRWLFVGCIIFSFLLVRFTSCFPSPSLTKDEYQSWPTSRGKRRRLSLAVISLMRSQMSWPTIITLSVSGTPLSRPWYLNSLRVVRPFLLFRPYQQFYEDQRRFRLFCFLYFQECVPHLCLPSHDLNISRLETGFVGGCPASDHQRTYALCHLFRQTRQSWKLV